MRLLTPVIAVLAAVLTLAACASEPTAVEPLAISSTERAMTVTTTACGHASKTSGAGVAVGAERVLVSAHVVIGASEIVVSSLDQPDLALAATVVRLDTKRDLAVLAVPGVQASPIQLAEAEVGDEVSVIGGGPSGAFAATITRRVEVRIDEVRSTTRSSRFGFELDRRVNLGDSGAGAFDAAGRLVAVIYGRSQLRVDASFAVRQQEIAAVLDEGTDQTWSCDPTQHRLVAAAATE